MINIKLNIFITKLKCPLNFTNICFVPTMDLEFAFTHENILSCSAHPFALVNRFKIEWLALFFPEFFDFLDIDLVMMNKTGSFILFTSSFSSIQLPQQFYWYLFFFLEKRISLFSKWPRLQFCALAGLLMINRDTKQQWLKQSRAISLPHMRVPG